MLPKIVSYARIAFRHLGPEARQEALQNVVANTWAAFVGLARRGKLDLAYPTVLARYAVAQVREGRKVGCKLNIRDVLSPYCQAKKGVIVERLDRFDEEENAWQDTRTAPVPEIVAFRCDFADWLASLKRRDRRIAESLAIGNRTGDVAKRFDVSAGRVSQLRHELADSWRAFVGEAAPLEATAAST